MTTKPDPDFTADAEQLYGLLLDPPPASKDAGVHLIRTFLTTAFSTGKVAGIDAALDAVSK